MKQLDKQLSEKPTPEAVAMMAELRIRNLQAFDELQSFNDKGKFLNKHPLLFGRSEFSKLLDLLRKEPAEFLRRHKNILDNIKRYKSYLKRDDRKAHRKKDRKSLTRYEERENMFQMVLEQHNSKQ